MIKHFPLFIFQEESELADQYLESLGIAPSDFLVGINPGAEYGPAKRWAPESFAKVADMLTAEYRAKILVFGSSKEMDVAAQ